MPRDAGRRAALAVLCLTSAIGLAVCRGANQMGVQSDQELIEALSSADPGVCNAVAAEIVGRGAQMIHPLLRLQGSTRFYAGGLGKPTGSTRITAPPRHGVILSPDQMERAVTVEVAVLYLIEAIYRGRLDFASGALLTDLAPARRASGPQQARADPNAAGFEAAPAMGGGGRSPRASRPAAGHAGRTRCAAPRWPSGDGATHGRRPHREQPSPLLLRIAFPS